MLKGKRATKFVMVNLNPSDAMEARYKELAFVVEIGIIVSLETIVSTVEAADISVHSLRLLLMIVSKNVRAQNMEER